MKYFDVIQGEEPWFKLRNGVPTASRFDMILTPKEGKPSTQQEKLINQLVGERLSLIPPEGVENYTNRAMRWGAQCEAEARAYFCFKTSLEVYNGGFCLDDSGRYGASPDALVGTETATTGALELKAPQAETQVEYLRNGGLPPAYRWQCQGHLLVTGLPVCWFLSYSPGLPPLLIRVERGPDTEKLAVALNEFWDRFMEAFEKVKGSAG